MTLVIISLRENCWVIRMQLQIAAALSTTLSTSTLADVIKSGADLIIPLTGHLGLLKLHNQLATDKFDRSDNLCLLS
jgi:hypothetical protein